MQEGEPGGEMPDEGMGGIEAETPEGEIPETQRAFEEAYAEIHPTMRPSFERLETWANRGVERVEDDTSNRVIVFNNHHLGDKPIGGKIAPARNTEKPPYALSGNIATAVALKLKDQFCRNERTSEPTKVGARHWVAYTQAETEKGRFEMVLVEEWKGRPKGNRAPDRISFCRNREFLG